MLLSLRENPVFYQPCPPMQPLSDMEFAISTLGLSPAVMTCSRPYAQGAVFYTVQCTAPT